MKREGSIAPRSGCTQRHSASTAVIWRVRRSKIGW
jgi:hypothetical protein